MRIGRLLSLVVLLLTSTWGHAQTQLVEHGLHPTAAIGYLLSFPSRPNAREEPQAIPYQPQPGDLILCDDHNRFYHFIFNIVNTAPPTHVAMVIEGADGKPALFEMTGPWTVTATVKVHDISARLNSYPGDIMVRRLREPLTPEQSRELTQFAYAQKGKRFAVGRIILQVTPFCPRTGLRHTLFGQTYLNRNRWFCSELVVAACTKARILSPTFCRANATYPRDLAADERINLSHVYLPPVPWSPGAAKR